MFEIRMLMLSSLVLFAGACASTPSAPPVTTTHPREVAEYSSRLIGPSFAEGSMIPDVTLRDAAQERVGVEELGPATVVRRWTWHPRGEEPYVVWITCRGQGAERVCGLAAAAKADPGSGGIRMTAFTHLGFSNPNVEAIGDKLELAGDDLRGAWTQVLEVVQDGTLKMGKRQYSPAP